MEVTINNCPSIKYKCRGKHKRYKYELTEEWKCIFKGYSFSILDPNCCPSKFLEFRPVLDSDKNVDNNSCYCLITLGSGKSVNDNSDYCLIIHKKYAWDGLSGPTIDTHSSMRGSLVHDALYQLMREKGLNCDKDRYMADNILYKFCRQDGMIWLYAILIYFGVRAFGRKYACPPKEYESPSYGSSDSEGEGHNWGINP